MSLLPLPPQLSAVLLTSERLACGWVWSHDQFIGYINSLLPLRQEILTLVSMLSTDSVMFTPHHKVFCVIYQHNSVTMVIH